MILVTGAGGQFGRAIIQKLVEKGEEVVAFEFQERFREDLLKLGVSKVFIGDLLNYEDVKNAFTGMDAVYHICSAYNPREVEIGEVVIRAAKDVNLPHFVFHSVLHSILSELPHHQKKHVVEEMLINSNVPFTIIQPSCLMQNTLMYFPQVKESGVFCQNFFGPKGYRLAPVDLQDVVEAIANILTDLPAHVGATYELCGPENLSQQDLCDIFSEVLGKPVKAARFPNEAIREALTRQGLSEYYISSALIMFDHYNEHGFVGSPFTLKSLLGREPKHYKQFVKENI